MEFETVLFAAAFSLLALISYPGAGGDQGDAESARQSEQSDVDPKETAANAEASLDPEDERFADASRED